VVRKARLHRQVLVFLPLFFARFSGLSGELLTLPFKKYLLSPMLNRNMINDEMNEEEDTMHHASEGNEKTWPG
jgi:hypothetical protein